jgi:hypothetical protein
MYLLPAAAVVTALAIVVGLSLWLRRHLEDDVQPRWARVLGIKSPGLIRILAVFDGVRALTLVAIPAVAVLFIATVDLTVSRLSVKQKKEGSRTGQAVGLPSTGGTTTVPRPTPPAVAGVSITAPTTVPCRNSTDPVCGPFRWDPPPAPNQPVEIEITRSPIAPKVGEQVTVTVNVAEADSEIHSVTVSFGDEEALTLPPATVTTCEGSTPTGPWTPPEVAPDATVATYGHTYTQPGDYTIDVYAASADFLDATCPPNPYASQGTASAPIHVG